MPKRRDVISTTGQGPDQSTTLLRMVAHLREVARSSNAARFALRLENRELQAWLADALDALEKMEACPWCKAGCECQKRILAVLRPLLDQRKKQRDAAR